MTHRPIRLQSELHRGAGRQRRHPWLPALLLACLLLFQALTGCSPGSNTTATTETSQTDSEKTSQTSVASTTTQARPSQTTTRPPSGPLRLFITTRSTLNPLADTSASFLSLVALIYEGLYTMDSSGAVFPALADSARFLEDGFTVEIQMAEGRRFHDGSPVTAPDVAASYAFVQSAGATSAYAGRLPDITNVTAVDDRIVRVSLSRAQPDYAWQLTFPIMPAAALQKSAANPLTILPGTGPYAISEYVPGTGMTLKAVETAAVDTKNQVETILVREMNHRSEAMRAFENDEIDLIDLPPEDYPEYKLRNGLRIERYFSGQYLFLSFNTSPGALLENAGRLALVKAISQDGRLMPDHEAFGLEPARVPVLPDSLVWARTPVDDPDRRQIYAAGSSESAMISSAFSTTRKKLVILAPQEDSLRTLLALRLKDLLDEYQIGSDVRILTNEAYLAERSAGQYDILMAQAVVLNPMDPRWLVGPAADQAVVGSEWLPRKGLDGHEAAAADVYRCFAAGTAMASEHVDLASVLRTVGDTGPFTGIGFRHAALLSGHRVIGQVRPHRENLFEGIEDIWIWSTFSS